MFEGKQDMRSTSPVEIPARLSKLVNLAQSLEYVEQGGVAMDADQYRSLVRQLADELREVPQDEALDLILSSFEATRVLYENLQYRHAGLCRSPLEKALNTEIAARNLLGKFRLNQARS